MKVDGQRENVDSIKKWGSIRGLKLKCDTGFTIWKRGYKQKNVALQSSSTRIKSLGTVVGC